MAPWISAPVYVTGILEMSVRRRPNYPSLLLRLASSKAFWLRINTTNLPPGTNLERQWPLTQLTFRARVRSSKPLFCGATKLFRHRRRRTKENVPELWHVWQGVWRFGKRRSISLARNRTRSQGLPVQKTLRRDAGCGAYAGDCGNRIHLLIFFLHQHPSEKTTLQGQCTFSLLKDNSITET